MNHLAIAPILLPLIAGIVLLFLRAAPLVVQRSLNIAASVAGVGVAVWLVLDTANATQVYRLGDWEAPFGILLVADRLAALMLMVTALVALPALLAACRGFDARGRHFHVLWQWQLFGLNGAFLTGDLFNLFVFFEILLLASYGLLLHGGGRLRVRAGLHFVVVNLVGSTLFLFAVGALYGVVGTLNMADLALKLAATDTDNLALVQTAGLLLFAVFALKAALLPFYLWLPAAYAHTGAPVAALFAIMTKVGVYAIVRVHGLLFGDEAGAVAGLLDAWLLPAALATLAVGILGALAATALRQQAAYFVVASVGTLLTGVALGTEASLAAALYYLPHSVFASALLFLIADVIARGRGELADRFEPGPVIARAAWLGGLFFFAAMASAGLPPLAGFLGKFMLLRAALDAAPDTGHTAWVWAVVLVTSLFAVIALARSGSLLFLRAQGALLEADSDSASNSDSDLNRAPHASPSSTSADAGPSGWLPFAVLTALLVALLVFAAPLYDAASATAAQLANPADYIDASLEARP